MINLVQNLETCWYLSPPWGKEIPPVEVSLLEKVYVTTTKSFGYCCGVEWSGKGWSYEIVSGNDNLTVLGREIIGTGNLQLVTKEKPVFGLGELVEFRFHGDGPPTRIAIAVAEAIRQLQPRVFTLENVPRYQNSQSFSIILSALEQEGYSVDYSVVNMADFGLPQARRRLVLVACQDLAISLPPTSGHIGWYEAIAHLIPMMPDSHLLSKQQQAVEQFLAANEPVPLLIERVGGRNGLKYKPGHKPCNTILRCLTTSR